MNQIDIDEIIAEFGDYYDGESRSINEAIYTGVIQQTSTLREFDIKFTEESEWRASKAEMSEVLQAYQDAYTPKGDLVFTPLSIGVSHAKVDLKYNPVKLWKSWLGFMSEKNISDPTQYPFAKWIVEMVQERIRRDLERSGVIYKGVFQAPTAGTPGSAINSMNGLRKFINDKVTSGEIVPIATGTMSTTPTTYYNQIYNFFKAIPEYMWGTQMELMLSPFNALKLREGIKELFNINYQQQDVARIPEFDAIIKPVMSMSGSNKIIVSHRDNRAVIARTNIDGEEMMMLNLEREDRHLKIFGDIQMGIGFKFGEEVFTNELA